MTAFYQRTGLTVNLTAAQVDSMFAALAVGSFQRHIAAPANGDVTIVLKTTHGGTITETATQTDSGTATITWKVNSIALTTTNAASSVLQAQAQSATFVAGDKIIGTVSAASSPVNLAVAIKFTRTIE